jgi:hypothetical protein
MLVVNPAQSRMDFRLSALHSLFAGFMAQYSASHLKKKRNVKKCLIKEIHPKKQPDNFTALTYG